VLRDIDDRLNRRDEGVLDASQPQRVAAATLVSPRLCAQQVVGDRAQQSQHADLIDHGVPSH